jgi:hypothetical protein
MKRQENSIKTVWRHLFRGIGIVFLIGLLEAVALFFHAGCNSHAGVRAREERTRAEAKERYERDRAEAQRAGTDPNSVVQQLNSGRWLPEERKVAK